MTNNDLINKIKRLETVRPSESWLKSNREFIFKYIDLDYKKESVIQTGFVFSVLAAKDRLISALAIFQCKMLASAAVTAAVLLLAGNFVVGKAEGSLPGDNLYSVKIFVEKAELAMMFSDEKRATLNFDLADKRLSELSLMMESAGGQKVSVSDVDAAMENFNNHLSAAVSEMSSVVRSDSSASKAVAVAKIANNKTSEYAKKIAKAKDAAGDKSDFSSIARSQVAETIKKIEEVNINALAVLAFLGIDNPDAAISREVSQKVGEKISEAMAKIDSAKQKISVADKTLIKASDIKLAFDLTEQAGNNLDEAKKYLAGDDSNKALEKVVASNDMISTAEKIIGASDAAAATPDPSLGLSPVSSPTPPDGEAGTADGIASPSPVPSLEPSVSPSPSVSPLAPSGVEGGPTATPSPTL